jgi:DNA helicase-2/ATP-dependent DNA helicase PcrA
MTKAIVIYGPPGTGKTRRLMEIMERLKDDRKVSPAEIGFFAFTRAAADEAKKRLGITTSKTMRTLHSLAFEAAKVSKEQVVDTDKLQKFAQLIRMPINGKAATGFDNVELGDEYLSLHNYSVARCVSVGDAFHELRPALDPAVARMVSEAYTGWKQSFGWKDFNDMVLDYVADPIDVGAKYLFIDEAQDLSPLQWQMVEGLRGHAVCLWLAGDDDQAVHQWAGAEPHGMSAYHSAGNQRVLEQSFRVPRAVHRMAERVIGRVARRVAKSYLPREEEGTVERYGFLEALPAPQGDTLMLYRNHTARKEAEEWLMHHGVPYRATGAFPSAFDGRWAAGARAWFRLRRGEQLPSSAYNQITRVAPHLAGAIRSKDFTFLHDAPSTHFTGIPMQTAEYLRRVDLFATPQVRISTIHAIKGAEADRVILLNGMGERTYEEMTDAEHRVWYVAVTRARHRLDIVDGTNAYNF